MAKVSTNISIDPNTKIEAQTLLAEFGMDLSTAVNIFLKQLVYERAFPFTISRETPNQVTIDAMNELQEALSSPEKYKRYDSVESMMEDILGEI